MAHMSMSPCLGFGSVQEPASSHGSRTGRISMDGEAQPLPLCSFAKLLAQRLRGCQQVQGHFEANRLASMVLS